MFERVEGYVAGVVSIVEHDQDRPVRPRGSGAPRRRRAPTRLRNAPGAAARFRTSGESDSSHPRTRATPVHTSRRSAGSSFSARDVAPGVGRGGGQQIERPPQHCPQQREGVTTDRLWHPQVDQLGLGNDSAETGTQLAIQVGLAVTRLGHDRGDRRSALHNHPPRRLDLPIEKIIAAQERSRTLHRGRRNRGGRRAKLQQASPVVVALERNRGNIAEQNAQLRASPPAPGRSAGRIEEPPLGKAGAVIHPRTIAASQRPGRPDIDHEARAEFAGCEVPKPREPHVEPALGRRDDRRPRRIPRCSDAR